MRVKSRRNSKTHENKYLRTVCSAFKCITAIFGEKPKTTTIRLVKHESSFRRSEGVRATATPFLTAAADSALRGARADEGWTGEAGSFGRRKTAKLLTGSACELFGAVNFAPGRRLPPPRRTTTSPPPDGLSPSTRRTTADRRLTFLRTRTPPATAVYRISPSALAYNEFRVRSCTFSARLASAVFRNTRARLARARAAYSVPGRPSRPAEPRAGFNQRELGQTGLVLLFVFELNLTVLYHHAFVSGIQWVIMSSF